MPNGAPVGAWNAGAWMHLKYFYATVGNSQIQRWILMSQEVDSEVIMASSTAITGKSLVSGASIKIMFTSDITGSNTSTVLSLTYNGTAYNVKVGKNGSLSNFVASEVSTGVYKYVQAYTTLELAFDGSQFIIIGNPVVLSSADYTIYADGKKDGYSVYARYITSGRQNTTNAMCEALGLTDIYLKEAFYNLSSTISNQNTGIVTITTGGPSYAFVLYKLYNNYYSAELLTYNQVYGLSIIKFICNDDKFYGVRIRY